MAKDPTYLLFLQHQGLEYERTVYDRFFPNALRIPERKNSAERHKLTVEAMLAGTPVILQGYLRSGAGVGVIDILENVGADSSSRTGFTYRVGEIKKSSTLMTAHVFQAAWYTELLEKTQGQFIHQACFILGTGERNIVDLHTVQVDYETTKKELSKIRESKNDPGPHLDKACPGCHWRSVCMPELIADQHISLVPGFSRRQASEMKNDGITTWVDIKTVSDSMLEAIGLGAYEIEQVRSAVKCIERDAPPLRQPLRPDIFQNLRIITLEFPELAEQRRAGERPVPSAIHYEDDFGQIGKIEVDFSSDGIMTANLTPFMNNKRLAFYGTTDITSFKQITVNSGVRIQNGLDIFMVVESFLHSPVPGLELEALHSYVTKGDSQRLIGADRVRAIREVINWIARSL